NASILNGSTLRCTWDPLDKQQPISNQVPDYLELLHQLEPPRLIATKWLKRRFTVKPPVGQTTRFDRRLKLIESELRKVPKSEPDKREPLELAAAMTQFDKHTDPTSLRGSRLKAIADEIVELTRYLAFRTLQRAAWSLHEREFHPVCRDDDDIRRCAK